MKNMLLTCKECEAYFVFTKEEQEKYMLLGIENLPSLCPNCKNKQQESNKSK